jgi:hypothetical protein
MAEQRADDAYSDMLSILSPHPAAGAQIPTEDSEDAHEMDEILHRHAISGSEMHSALHTDGSMGHEGENPFAGAHSAAGNDSVHLADGQNLDDIIEIDMMSNASDDCDDAGIYDDDEEKAWPELDHLREEVNRMKADLDANGGLSLEEYDEEEDLQRMEQRHEDQAEQEELERYLISFAHFCT